MFLEWNRIVLQKSAMFKENAKFGNEINKKLKMFDELKYSQYFDPLWFIVFIVILIRNLIPTDYSDYFYWFLSDIDHDK